MQHTDITLDWKYDFFKNLLKIRKTRKSTFFYRKDVNVLRFDVIVFLLTQYIHFLIYFIGDKKKNEL